MPKPNFHTSSTSTSRTLKYIPVISVSMRGSHVCSFSDTSTSCCIKNQEPIPSDERRNVQVISASMQNTQSSSDTPGSPTLLLLPASDPTNLEETERNILLNRQQACVTICDLSGSLGNSAQATTEAARIAPLTEGSTSSNETEILSSYEGEDSQARGSSSPQIPVLSISDCGEIIEIQDLDIHMNNNSYNQDDNTEGIRRKHGVYAPQHPCHISDPYESHLASSQSLPIAKSSRHEHSLVADYAYSMNKSKIDTVQNTTKANSNLKKSLELIGKKCTYCKKRLYRSKNLLEHLNKRCGVLREMCNANKASNVNRASRKNTATSRIRDPNMSRASNMNTASNINTASNMNTASTSNMSGRHFQDESGLHSQRLTETRKRLKTSNLNKHRDQFKVIKIQDKMVDVKVKVKKVEENGYRQNQNGGGRSFKMEAASPLQCRSCKKSFSKPGNLRRHVELLRCLVLDRTWVVKECPETSNPKKYLEQFKQICVENEAKMGELKDNVKKERKCFFPQKKRNDDRAIKKEFSPVECPSCHTSFSVISNLNKHIWLKRCPGINGLSRKGQRLLCCRKARRYLTPAALASHVAKEHGS